MASVLSTFFKTRAHVVVKDSHGVIMEPGVADLVVKDGQDSFQWDSCIAVSKE